MFRLKGRQRSQIRQTIKWTRKITKECERLKQGTLHFSKHSRELERRLLKVTALMAYHEAVMQLLRSYPEQIQNYLDTYYRTFLFLARRYHSRPPMERAFYAYLMYVYHPNRRENAQLGEILLTYFDNSTVYCRENILLALYSMGREGAVERAFSLMSARGWYHDRRLLADGLGRFAGDHEKLAQYLWIHCGQWNEVFQVAVIQFASRVSGAFAEEFLAALKNPETPLEVRFALVRYFQHRYNSEVYGILLELLENGKAQEGGLAVAAASALAAYPGNETRRALLEALHSRNYYVRRNAAASLITLGITKEEIITVSETGDQYAAEMLEYMLEKNTPVSLNSETKEKENA